jgi:hypothetical protein
MKKIFVFLLALVQWHPVFASDKLDEIHSNDKVIVELKDVYRAFKINHIISDQKEMLNLLSDESPDQIKTFVAQYISIDEKLNAQNINDPRLRSYIDSYLVMTNKSYEMLKSPNSASAKFNGYNKKYEAMYGRYISYLTTHYAVSYFVNLTEDQYWKNIDKNNYAHATQYTAFLTKEKTDVTASRQLLEGIIPQTTDAQETAIYKIALADQYVKYDTVTENADEKAASLYKSIIDEHRYSIYLFEAWLKWRLVTQRENGLSKSSDIPNDLYDSLREQAAYTALDYISKHPEDEMAKNEFLVIASHDIIRRFGDYPYGNQSTIEYHETFDDDK